MTSILFTIFNSIFVPWKNITKFFRYHIQVFLLPKAHDCLNIHYFKSHHSLYFFPYFRFFFPYHNGTVDDSCLLLGFRSLLEAQCKCYTEIKNSDFRLPMSLVSGNREKYLLLLQFIIYLLRFICKENINFLNMVLFFLRILWHLSYIHNYKWSFKKEYIIS